MQNFFDVQKEWLVNNMCWGGTEILSYALVEISLNRHIFLVDAEIEVKVGGTLLNRYIMGSVADTISFIDQPGIIDSKITLVSTRHANKGDYGISDLVEISVAKDEKGQTSYILKCKNGMTYIDSPFANSIDGLTDLKMIYQKNLTKE